MTRYHVDQRVEVFDPDLQRDIPGFVTAVTVTCVLVSLDDRMVPVVVDPANTNQIRPLAVTHA